MQKIWDIAMVVTGTVIGAGFASGQEINQYFVSYGFWGLCGIFLSSLMFTLIIALVLCKISVTGASEPQEYLGEKCPSFLKNMYKLLSVSFMFVTYCTMISACGEIFCRFGCEKIVGCIVMNIVCLVCFAKGEEGLVGINKLLVPLMIIIIFAVFVNCVITPVGAFDLFYNAGTSAFVYVSYNTISIIAVLTAVSSKVKNKSTALISAFLSGMLVLVSSLCVWYVLTVKGGGGEFPMLNALSGFSRVIYLPTMVFALATTAVSCGFGVVKEFKKRRCAATAIVVCSTVLAQISFESFVGRFYSVFGYVGIVVAVYTICDGVKYLKPQKSKKFVGIKRNMKIF